MNCREANRILDTSPSDIIDGRQIRAAEQHIRTCSQCRETWHAYKEIAALRSPPVPPELRQRVGSLLTSSSPKRQSARPYLLIGAALAVGAAVAATLALQGRDSEQLNAVKSVDTSYSGNIPTNNPGQSSPAPTALPGILEPAPTTDGERVSDLEWSQTQEALDPNSVVVVLKVDDRLAPEIAALCRQFYDELLRQLGAISDLNVMPSSLVDGYLRMGTAEEQIAQELGAGQLILLTATSEPQPSLSGILANIMLESTGGGTFSYLLHRTRWPQELPDDVASLVEWLEGARTFRSDTERSEGIIEAQSMVLNASLSPSERVGALRQLPYTGEAHTDAVVMAAVELATLAPELRGSIWQSMYGIDDPYLIEPLLDSLVYGPSDYARQQAAAALNAFVTNPRVESELMRAGENDASEVVRKSARQALMTESERNQAALQILLDTNLPAKERLNATILLDGRFVRSLPMTDEAAQAVFDIGATSADPNIRSSAWGMLGRGDVENARFKSVLLEDLENHSDDDVRGGAALALSPYADDPVIRSALEEAKSDPAYRVRSIARSALRKGAD